VLVNIILFWETINGFGEAASVTTH